MEMGEEPQVKTAAAVFQDLCYSYRDQLSAGIICAGWDRKKGGQVSSPSTDVFINKKGVVTLIAF